MAEKNWNNIKSGSINYFTEANEIIPTLVTRQYKNEIFSPESEFLLINHGAIECTYMQWQHTLLHRGCHFHPVGNLYKVADSSFVIRYL